MITTPSSGASARPVALDGERHRARGLARADDDGAARAAARAGGAGTISSGSAAATAALEAAEQQLARIRCFSTERAALAPRARAAGSASGSWPVKLVGHAHHVLGRALRDHAPAAVAALGAEVDRSSRRS